MKTLSLILNLFKKHPDLKSADLSGIVRSNHPVKGKGWIKGWVLDTPTRDIVIVCKHSNPSTSDLNNKIFVIDKDDIEHERTITCINKDPFNALSGHPYYNGSDIAICKLNSPLPDNIAAYKIYHGSNVYHIKTSMLTQDNAVSTAVCTYRGQVPYLTCLDRTIQLKPGDSGLPWFVYDKGWKVISHTHRGWHGEGPDYSKLKKEIMDRAAKLSA